MVSSFWLIFVYIESYFLLMLFRVIFLEIFFWYGRHILHLLHCTKKWSFPLRISSYLVNWLKKSLMENFTFAQYQREFLDWFYAIFGLIYHFAVTSPLWPEQVVMEDSYYASGLWQKKHCSIDILYFWYLSHQ